MLLQTRANHIDASATAHDLAMLTHFFYGRTDFHLCSPPSASADSYLKLFIPVGNSAPAQVIRGKLDGNAVARQDFNIVHPHFSGDMRENAVIVFQDHPEGRVLQAFLDNTVDFYGLFLRRA
jgi:hypothetical protein